MTWVVKFFQTARGESPVEEFIEELEGDVQPRVARAISWLETFGPFIKPPYAKKVSGDLYELRILGSNQIRILYTSVKGEYYLLHAFKKKQQKIPTKEIKTALDRATELV